MSGLLFKPEKSMPKASIDIGTNTVLLLVADVQDGSLTVLREEQRIPRLGQGVDDSGQLSEAAMQRVIAAIVEYQALLRSEYGSGISPRLTATSAVRDASNKQQFAKRIRKETGLELDILSGMEEAQLTFIGARSVLDDALTTTNVIIDIGGGSTEVAMGKKRDISDRYSFDMGCVRYTERFLQELPPKQNKLDECRSAIRDMLKSYRFNFDGSERLIGVAGTVTSLAYIDLDLSEYNSNYLSGHTLTADNIASHIHKIQRQTADELEAKYPVVMSGRSDIFLAGLLILNEFMRSYNFDKILTSTGGIRHGAIMKNSG